jgi:hypothetical protein
MALTGFSIAEDEALKKRVSGITVKDDKSNAREVKVFFRWPTDDVESQYPFITIELIDIQHALDRETSAQTVYLQTFTNGTGDPMEYLAVPSRLPYWPDETPDAGTLLPPTTTLGATVELTPVNFLYRIATHARSQMHDRQMTSALLGRGRLPFRYGELFVDADDTVRRLFNLGWQSADFADNEAGGRKRIFRKIYTLSVNGEMGYEDFRATGVVDEMIIGITGQADTFSTS